MSQQIAPHRAATTPRHRRIARLVLVIGSAVAVASIFGPIWAVRVGVVLSVVAAVVAVAYAWSEAAAERRAGAAALLSATREHSAALTSERTRNGEVVEVLTGRVTTTQRELADRDARVEELTGTVGGLRSTVADLTGTVSSLRGDVVSLRVELTERDVTIDGLRDVVASRDAELRLLSGEDLDETDAEVHVWPRRVWSDGTGVADVHATGEVPAVVDLHADQTTGISNYEASSYGRTARQA